MLACTGTVRSMLERDNMHLAAVVEELMRTCEFAKFYGDGKNLTEARWEAFWKGNKASKCEDGIRFCVEIKVSDDRFMIFIGMPDSKYERGISGFRETMSCYEIIDPKDLTDAETLAEELKKETFDVNLPNGAKLIQHAEKAYSNLYSNGKSFDDLEEKRMGEAYLDDEIQFLFNFKIHPDGVKKMKSVGNTIQSNTLVIQHKCVMYSYAYALTVAAEDPEPVCEFRLFPISHTYRHPTGQTKGGVQSTMKQKAPELADVRLKIGMIESAKLDLIRELDGSYKCTTLITLETLKNITKRVEIYIKP
ncbi:unnamed protein product [Caenorhabditis angaria]|uniref:Uncharacterized protein n=1 Tax=Caenorhabditis angaria TaxID=860376 RepID=A0A9P1IDY2_9PELO|nr:unnamed protein product [Caenorhabditis angaria]